MQPPLAQLREERRRMATSWGGFAPSSWSTPVFQNAMLVLAFCPVVLFVSALPLVGKLPEGGDLVAILAFVALFWIGWGLAVAALVRALRQRPRLRRQREAAAQLAARLGGFLGHGVWAFAGWLDAYWEAAVAPELFRVDAYHWSLCFTLEGFPVLFDLAPVGRRGKGSSPPRFVAALAAWPPTAQGATSSWGPSSAVPPSPQLRWLQELGLRFEHSSAGLMATGDAEFIRQLELDPSWVPRLEEVARVMADHARSLGARPRERLP